MRANIHATSTQNNTYTSFNSISDYPSLYSYNRLSKSKQKILQTLYSDRLLGVEKSDRSLREWGQILQLRPDYVSVLLVQLTEDKWIESDPHGRAFKRRWITLCAFSVVDTLNTNQTTNQILPMSNIDLSDQEMIENKILKEAQSCEQIEEIQNTEERLTTFLDRTKVSAKDQIHIKKALLTSPVGQARAEKIIDRVIASSRKKWIVDKRSYFLAALKTEERNVAAMKSYFSNKNVNLNLYAMG